MASNLTSLLSVYYSLGGKSSDVYQDIAYGTAVRNYKLLADVIAAIGKKTGEIKAYATGISAKDTIGAPVLTEKVDAGTKILNQLWSDRMIANVGYYYNTSTHKLQLYVIFGTTAAYEYTTVTKALMSEEGGDAYELTVENAPTATVISGATNAYYKYKGNKSVTLDADNRWTCDVRFVRQFYDSKGNEVDRIYSAQYRYSVEDGAMTRERYATAKIYPNDVIEIGVMKNIYSASLTLNGYYPANTAEAHREVYPLVTHDATAQFDFVIPDSFFEDAEFGASLYVRMGDGSAYIGSSFMKAEASGASTGIEPSYIRIAFDEGVWSVTDVSQDAAANLVRLKELMMNRTPLLVQLMDIGGAKADVVYEWVSREDEFTGYQCLYSKLYTDTTILYKFYVAVDEMLSVNEIRPSRVTLYEN